MSKKWYESSNFKNKVFYVATLSSLSPIYCSVTITSVHLFIAVTTILIHIACLKAKLRDRITKSVTKHSCDGSLNHHYFSN